MSIIKDCIYIIIHKCDENSKCEIIMDKFSYEYDECGYEHVYNNDLTKVSFHDKHMNCLLVRQQDLLNNKPLSFFNWVIKETKFLETKDSLKYSLDKNSKPIIKKINILHKNKSCIIKCIDVNGIIVDVSNINILNITCINNLPQEYQFRFDFDEKLKFNHINPNFTKKSNCILQ